MQKIVQKAANSSIQKTLLSLAITAALTGAVAFSGNLQAAQFNASPGAEGLREEAAAAEQASVQQSARELAQAFLKNLVNNGVLDKTQGWQKSSEQYVALSISNFKERAPDMNPDFLNQRSVLAQESLLKAKESIIRFIRTDLSSELIMTLPNTGLSTDYDKALQSFKYELMNAKADYQDALQEVDQAQAERLKGITQDDLIEAGIGSLFAQQTGIQVDTAGIEAAKAERLNKARQRLMQLEQTLADLKQQAQALQGALKKETTSSIRMLASMPVSGAVVVSQFESWIDGTYEIANIVTWSPKAESMARALAMKEAVALPPSNRSLGDFMAQDWSTATGSRKFVDNQGDYYVLGIGQALAGEGAGLDVAQEIATLVATNEIGRTIMADVSSESELQRKAQEVESGGLEGLSTTEFAQSLEKSVQERVQGLQLQGVDYTVDYTQNPITGQDVVVVIASLGVTNAQSAARMEKESFRNAEVITNANQRSSGVRSGLETSLAQEQADTSAFDAGHQEGLTHGEKITRGGTVKQQSDSSTQTGNVSIQAAGSNANAFGY